MLHLFCSYIAVQYSTSLDQYLQDRQKKKKKCDQINLVNFGLD